MITIFVNTQKENININFDELSSIYSLKHEIAKNQQINTDIFFFKWKGKIIDENQTLKYYGIKNNDTLQFIEKKKGGTTVTEIGMILMAIFMGFFMIAVTFFGLFPILSYTLASFIKTIFRNLGAFIIKISNVNQLLSKIIKSAFFKFVSGMLMKFIDFFSLIIFTYVITMGCSYFAFTLRAKNNFCSGFNHNKKLAKIVTITFVILFFLFNLPMYLIKLVQAFEVMSILKTILDPICKVLNRVVKMLRQVLYAIPFIGQIYKGYLTASFIGLTYFKKFQKINSALLFKFCKVAGMFVNDPFASSMIEEFDMQGIINMFMFINDCPGKGLMELNKNQIRSAYIMKWLYRNSLYLLFLLGGIMNNTCESEELIEATNSVDVTKNQIFDLIEKIGYEKIEPNTLPYKLINEQIDKLIPVLENQINEKKEIERNNTVNADCLYEYLAGGVWCGPITLLVWLIAFIVLIIKT